MPNVGIGVTAPGYKVDVAGDVNISGNYRVNGTIIGGGSGTVTSVTSANSYLSVATGTTTPALTLNVGTAANMVAAGNDSRITGALQQATAFAGDVSGVYSATSVDKIKGTGVAITALGTGNFLKYNGTNWVNSLLSLGDVTTGLGYTPVNKAGDTMTGLLVLSADPGANLGASTKQYVDSSTSTAAANYVRKDGTVALTADWDLNGATAGGTRKITGLVDPTVADGAATKNYADTIFLTKSLPAAPAAGQNGQSLRWNNTTPAWEFYTPTGTGDFLKDGSLAMTGSLKMGGNTINGNSTASGNLTLDSTSNATKGYVLLSPTGGNVGIGTTTPASLLTVTTATNDEGITLQGAGAAANVTPVFKFNDSGGSTFARIGIAGGNSNLTGGSNLGELVIRTESRNMYFNTNGGGSTAMMIAAGTGNVGIGTTSPGSNKLYVYGDGNSSALVIDANPWNVSGNYSQMYNGGFYNGNGTNTGTIRHMYNYLYTGDSRTLNNIRAIDNTVDIGSNGTTTQAVGSWNNVNTGYSAGGVTDAYGSVNMVYHGSNAATITNGYGVYAGVFKGSTGALTNAYGLYVDALGGTNRWGIYQSASADQNYFAGNVGIGVTTPQAALDVVSTGTASALIVPRATTGNRPTALVNGMIRYNSSTTLFEFYQNGVWVNYTTVSDGRLKTNVEPVKDGLQIVNQLNPVFYDWDRTNPKTSGFEDKHQVGFIAQEVEKVLPEVVNHGEDGYRSLEYGKMVSVVIAAVKELYSKVTGLEARNADQDREIASVKADNASKDREIAELKIKAEKAEKENAVAKARLDKIEKMLRTR